VSDESSADEPAPHSLVHELKTALAMVVGFAELLQRDDDPAGRAEAGQEIARAAERLRSAVEAMTGVSLEGAPERRDGAPPPPRSDVMLIVDEHPARVRQLRAACPPESFDLLHAPDPDAAFSLLDSRGADVAVLDWDLTGGLGPETLAELKLRRPDLPVVVVSDDPTPRQRRMATLLEADAFLVRPLDPAALLGKAAALAAQATRGSSNQKVEPAP
jgi:CheY-like chemotaxis protein